jgi:hypothetical protein
MLFQSLRIGTRFFLAINGHEAKTVQGELPRLCRYWQVFSNVEDKLPYEVDWGVAAVRLIIKCQRS